MSDQPTESDWQDNTGENPFFRSPVAAEVQLRDGKVRLLKCPRCSCGLMGMVVRWRKVAGAEEELRRATEAVLAKVRKWVASAEG